MAASGQKRKKASEPAAPPQPPPATPQAQLEPSGKRKKKRVVSKPAAPAIPAKKPRTRASKAQPTPTETPSPPSDKDHDHSDDEESAEDAAAEDPPTSESTTTPPAPTAPAKIHWTAMMTGKLVELLKQMILDGRRSDNKFKMDVWNEIALDVVKNAGGPAGLTGAKCQARFVVSKRPRVYCQYLTFVDTIL